MPSRRHIRGAAIAIDTNAPPIRSKKVRYCQECGKAVCSYKDAGMDKVWCYAHDHLTNWTRPYIVGSYDHCANRGKTEYLLKRGPKSSDTMKGR